VRDKTKELGSSPDGVFHQAAECAAFEAYFLRSFEARPDIFGYDPNVGVKVEPEVPALENVAVVIAGQESANVAHASVFHTVRSRKAPSVQSRFSMSQVVLNTKTHESRRQPRFSVFVCTMASEQNGKASDVNRVRDETVLDTYAKTRALLISIKDSLTNKENEESDMFRLIKQHAVPGMFSRAKLNELLEEGLSVDSLDALVSDARFSKSEITELVAPERTLRRRKKNSDGVLSVEESERVVRLARTFELAMDTFGDEEKANRWLRRKTKLLSERTPLSMLKTHEGELIVEELLEKIGHGIAA